jgi:F0F1-type ATP synthase membrane subunit c/vacuolar-type H+-ATPase subunit K
MTFLLKRRGLLAKSMLVVSLVSLLVPLFTTVASASSGVSQGYTTKTPDLVAGSMMGLSPNTNTAEPATSDGSYQLLGLVADKPLIALSDGRNQVQIVISGPAYALVSDLNGTIKAGDKIASSPIVGVGMKATEPGQVVGSAQTDFSKIKTVEQTITDKSGKKHTTRIGSMQLQVNVSYFAGVSASQSALGSIMPPFFLQAANAIAGEPVSPLRVLIGMLALLFGFVISGIMLQSAVRSGMVSIGRNPLAKKAVRRQLFDVMLTALGVLIVTAIVMYFVLKI